MESTVDGCPNGTTGAFKISRATSTGVYFGG